ncbi:SUN domain-containing protein 1 isoform a [Homo sapiens]|uniref:SUN domain-containing protein 1 n=2 Tax=Homo sapiens TaxID=9606 RepID=SUN1_HUMAN|nr:SUN domain-containing protein 1 isoform a [Homo sapiens]NP_001354562.1 SUN domain-containing protein 1 isoform a [Homo sapiens]NP_001354563.1 SUN domain-containing protein 1 isoform a [Homo sapiens]O94901.4 RecName: Full=SUN domain-containing protein 1; AltName: Full=Protein unc-84 homolog A; AltName: Full=Sad1/unc-84 protein-like 1 [Homo sapiens]|eukprot:NP_001124437.1 SUN domain-containing protein 1 isoform a [Homo sapiens]
MDFSRLHMYSPPQCVPENTGYTYALSSSYSSDALDFETEHKLDPVFDSPRMSRRSLRLATTACTLGDGEAVGADSGTSSAVSLKNRAARTTKQRRSTNKSAFSINHVSRQVTSSGVSHGGTVSLQDAVTRRPPVLDESWIREQTTVDHFWGLDDDGDLKGGNKAAIQGNGDVGAAAATAHNGFSCSNCSMLSERKDVLTAHPAAPGPVSRVYSRDRNQKCYFLLQILRRIGAVGQAVSRTAWSALWLAVVAPGKAASGVFWWLGIGWYQFVTLISWLNVFLLTRCLRNICKFLVLLIPLFLLLAGLSLRGQGNFFSFLPVLNWASMHRTQRVDDPQDVFKPTTSRLKQPLQGDSEAFPWHWMSGVEQQVASLSGQCHHHGENLRELTTLLQKLQARVDQMEGGAAGPSASVRDAVGQPPRETDFMAFHQEHEVRMSHLEDILGKLREKSEAIQKELEQTKQKTISAVGEQLLPTVEHLQLELDQLKSELSSWRHVKTGCETVDAVQERVDVQVREMVKLLFSEDQQGGSLEQLLQRFSSQFVSKGDLQTMLRDLQLQILRNVTHHVSVTKQLPTSEAVVSAVSEAGASGITEAQARAIVNSALKLYSQDKTGMVDFALESGGGSILSTRCSETYETKTALMSLFGIPLWYFSQSPRVVIQPDIYPGNCWAFKGSQGYLVVRLSMMIHPAAFTLEHIPKTLSPTGNISSAPKDFAVYGLENEYQEEGQLLGQFTYDQDGESLQMFQALKRPDDTAFQIVELRIFSNWGHPEYTCLYRFRVHGEPVK